MCPRGKGCRRTGGWFRGRPGWRRRPSPGSPCKAKAEGEPGLWGKPGGGGSLLVRVERLPREGFLAEMARLAEEALLKKAEVESS